MSVLMYKKQNSMGTLAYKTNPFDHWIAQVYNSGDIEQDLTVEKSSGKDGGVAVPEKKSALEDAGAMDAVLVNTHQVLDLSQCQNIPDVGVSSILKSTPNLLELDLSYCCSVTPSMVRSFQKCPKLRTLKLEGCKFMADGLETIGTSCVSLRELSLSKCSVVTDTELSFSMSRLKNLLKLDITCCRNITDVTILCVAALMGFFKFQILF